MPLLSFSVIKHNIEACDPKLQPGMSEWQEGTESLKLTQISVSVAFCSLGQVIPCASVSLLRQISQIKKIRL